MDDKDMELTYLSGIAVASLLMLGLICYGSFTLGRRIERTALTEALERRIESIYQDGYRDGLKVAMDECDLELEGGRY